MPAEPDALWRTARRALSLDRPVILGILTVTPDSFSDGGRYSGTDAALAHADSLLKDGALVIDVGGESTRPGRTAPVPAPEELRRVVPVIEALVRRHPDLLISVDTVKSDVARAALDAGAAILNDVSAFRLDPAMAKVAAGSGAGVILMHSRGGLLEIASYQHADYAGDVVGGVIVDLRGSLSLAAAAGIDAAAIVVDPGIGFSKTVEQSIELFDQLGALQALGRPVLVGPSRKRFLRWRHGTAPRRRRAPSPGSGERVSSGYTRWRRHARRFRSRTPSPVRSCHERRHNRRRGAPAVPRGPRRRGGGARRLRPHPGADRDLLGCR
jgi:dihydropteroate synthase